MTTVIPCACRAHRGGVRCARTRPRLSAAARTSAYGGLKLLTGYLVARVTYPSTWAVTPPTAGYGGWTPRASSPQLQVALGEHPLDRAGLQLFGQGEDLLDQQQLLGHEHDVALDVPAPGRPELQGLPTSALLGVQLQVSAGLGERLDDPGYRCWAPLLVTTTGPVRVIGGARRSRLAGIGSGRSCATTT